MPVSTGPRGPYAKTAALRARILDAAREVFADTGYRATTMRAIAERAEISQRGLVHHFPTKEALLTGVLEVSDARVAASFPNDSGPGALYALAEMVVADIREPRIAELYAILSAEASAPDHPAHDYYRRRYDTFRRYVEEQFEEARAAGTLREGVPSALLAVMFTALVDGVQTQWLYGGNAVADVGRTLRIFLDDWLRPDPDQRVS